MVRLWFGVLKETWRTQSTDGLKKQPTRTISTVKSLYGFQTSIEHPSQSNCKCWVAHFVKASPWVSDGVEVRRPQQEVALWCLQCQEWEGMAWLPLRPSEFQGTFRGQPSRCRASPVGTCLLSAGAPLLTPFLVRKDLPHRTATSESLYLEDAKISCSLSC